MYAVVFSLLTERTSIHATGCRYVTAAKNKNQPYSVWEVDAATPQEAARVCVAQHQFNERGLQEPKICKCAT